MSGGHFTLDELRACCRGEDWSLIKPVVEHCRTCELCGDRVAVFLAMNRIRAQRPVVEGIVSPNTAKVVAGVVIAVAVGLLVAGYQWASTDLPPSEDVAELATAQPPPGGDVAGLATTEPPPAGVVRFLLGSAVAVDAGDLKARLQAAGQALTAGEYSRATTALEGLHAEHPDSGVIAGFLGISLYLSGEDTDRVGQLLATGALDQNRTVSSFSRWYLANHLLRAADEEGARQLLKLFAADDDIPGRLAAELLARLERAPLP
jgi:hypothetical protein